MPQPGRTDLVMAVHVSGAVLSPGVYEMERGSRICDAVRLAGGFLPDADTQWCNQAQPLADGDHLTIHTLAQTQSMKEEGLTPVMDRFGIVSSLGAEHSAEEGTAGRGQNIGSAAGTGDDRVDLNTADEAQLMTLPGIGESRAQDILAYRSRNGRFTDTEELMQISGIGQKIYDRIKDRVRVS